MPQKTAIDRRRNKKWGKNYKNHNRDNGTEEATTPLHQWKCLAARRCVAPKLRGPIADRENFPKWYNQQLLPDDGCLQHQRQVFFTYFPVNKGMMHTKFLRIHTHIHTTDVQTYGKKNPKRKQIDKMYTGEQSCLSAAYCVQISFRK